MFPEIIPVDRYEIPKKQAVFDPETSGIVTGIIQRVIEGGDIALKDITAEIDHVLIDDLRIQPKKIENAHRSLDYRLKVIFESAMANIEEYHQKTSLESWEYQKGDDSTLGMKVTPIDRVGIYIPGGRAVYPSTVFMNIIPAKIAGVKSIALFSPPAPDGQPHPLILACCGLLGIDEVYAIGGAQAIAAMAYGTESIEPVYKICGPGNKYVAEAKRQVFGKVGIDSIAGPSEIVILHDDDTIPAGFIAYDMMAQAEHDEDAKSILITTNTETAETVQKMISRELPSMQRNKMIGKALKQHGKIIVCDNLEQGISLINKLAPEHLELMLKNPTDIQRIRNAGAIFIGKWSAVALGDYIAGPNHTLPTEAAGMYASPLSVTDFQKKSSVICYSETLFKQHAESAAYFADSEGLYAHAASLRRRLD